MTIRQNLYNAVDRVLPGSRRLVQSINNRPGGIYNPNTGLGTAADNLHLTSFLASVVSQGMLDRLCVESWFAKAFVNMLVDDMSILWREFDGPDAEAMHDAETRYEVREKVSLALKNSRKYGTGLIIMVTRRDPLDSPLDEQGSQFDDLIHLLVSDNYHVDIVEFDEDLYSPTYSKPILYRIRADNTEHLIHYSRVLRFDGGTAPNRHSGSLQYGANWAPTPLIPAISAAYGEAAMAAAVMHLSQESSVMSVKLKDFNERVADHGFQKSRDPRMSVKEELEAYARMKSSFRVNVVDAESDIERTEVQWRGFDRIIDINYKRLAAIAGIPATRLLGSPPVGFNATGESDMRNYAMHVKALQESQLTEPLSRLDFVVARSAGLAAAPGYEFKPLTDMSDLEKSQIAMNVANATQIFHSIGAIDEDESREAADQLGIYGEGLADTPAPGEPEPDMVIMPAPADDEDAA